MRWHLTLTSGNPHTYLGMSKKYLLSKRHLISGVLKKKHGICLLTDKGLDRGTVAYLLATWTLDMPLILSKDYL